MHLEQWTWWALGLGVMSCGQTWSHFQNGNGWGAKEEMFLEHPSGTVLGALFH